MVISTLIYCKKWYFASYCTKVLQNLIDSVYYLEAQNKKCVEKATVQSSEYERVCIEKDSNSTIMLGSCSFILVDVHQASHVNTTDICQLWLCRKSGLSIRLDNKGLVRLPTRPNLKPGKREKSMQSTMGQ